MGRILFYQSPDDPGFFRIKSPFQYKETIKQINGRRWNQNAKVWEVPLSNLAEALNYLPEAELYENLGVIVEDLQARNEQAIAIKVQNEAPEHLKTVPGLKGTLYGYQAVGKEFLKVLGPQEGAVLGFDMGLGKTISSLATFLELYQAGVVSRCLIVAPASLKYSAWEKEISKWTDLPYIIIDGNPDSPEDKKVLVDREVERWVKGPDGKRKYELVPKYQKTKLQLTEPYPDIEKVALFRQEPEKLCHYTKSFNPEKDRILEFVVDQNTGEVVQAVIEKYDGDKKKFIKEKTGEWEEAVITMTGKDLRKVQYEQDDRVILVTNYESFLSDTDIMPDIDNSWVVILDECFPYDTLITLSDGTHMRIGDMVEKSEHNLNVKSYNTETGQVEVKPVVKYYKNKRKTRMLQVTLSNGTTIKMTENHKVYTKNRGYVLAKELKKEDTILCVSSVAEIKFGQVTEMVWLDEEPEYVYNIEVEDNHNYFANGLLVSNCHRIKNPRAQTTKNLLAQCKPAGRKYLLSGTPLENNIEELWSIMDFCRDGILGTNYAFRQRYFELDAYNTPIMVKPHLLPELKQKMAPLIMRKRKDEVLKDLPPLIEQEYWVEMTAEQEKLYNAIREGILETEEEVTYLDVLAQLTRIQQVLDSPALLREVIGDDKLPEESGKLIELYNILEDINLRENKIILFSQYRQMTDILHKRMLQAYGADAVRYIHGGVKSQLRGVYQNDFQNNANVRIMILTTAGNYGLDLYKASYVICYDQLFNPQKMNQVVSRAHRHGAEDTVIALHLVTRKSYEEKKLKMLEEKKEIFKAFIDDDAAAFEKFVTKEELKSLLL